MAAALLRPELPVVARATSPAIAERMQAFGTPSRGQPVRPVRRPPAAGAARAGVLPAADLAGERAGRRAARAAARRRRTGRWVVCGYGRFGRELTADLRAEGLEVTVIEPAAAGRRPDDPSCSSATGPTPGAGAGATSTAPSGFVAGTDNDTTNLSLVAAARRRNPDAVRRGPAEPAGQRAAVRGDGARRAAGAHRGGRARGVRAAVSTPLLWRFLREMPAQGDAWAAGADRPAHRAVRRPACRRCGRCG